MIQTRLKRLVDLKTEFTNGGPRPLVALEYLESGTGNLLPAAELADSGAVGLGVADVAVGDVLFGKLRPYLAKSWVADRPCVASTELMCLRPRAGIDSRWLGYVVRSRPFIDWAVATSDGTKMPRTSWGKLGEFRMVVPTSTTQRAIAELLDFETSRINALVDAKRRMVELLDERLAIYTRELLMSGGPPLQPLKRTWQVVDCKHRTPTYVDHGYPVISPGDTTPGRLNISRAHRFVDTDDYRDLTEGGRQPRRGDIVYSRNASIGIASFVDTDSPFCMGQDVCLISSDHASQLYLTYFLNSLGLDQLEEQKVGATFSRVNIAQILELVVPTTHPEEQHRVALRLDEVTNSQRAAVTCLGKQLALLQERRQALITAAVTGQLDIAEAA